MAKGKKGKNKSGRAISDADVESILGSVLQGLVAPTIAAFAKETSTKKRPPGKKKGGKVKRAGYKKGAKVERAEKDPRDGYGYNRAYYGNQRRPKTL